MPDLFADPRDEFLQQSDFTEQEQGQIYALGQRSPSTAKAALALGGLYLLYRLYLKRKLTEHFQKSAQADAKILRDVAMSSWQAFIPWWVGIAATQLMSGYVEGVRQAQAGTVDQELLYNIAQNYAAGLGDQINDVTVEALVSGFQAQVNRKVPPIMAAKRAASAVGAPPRYMNSLVNIWLREEPKQTHDRPTVSTKDAQVNQVIEQANSQRAKQIGDTEMFTVQNQAKQIVWMTGISSGVIPPNTTRKWITAADERVCPACGPMDQMETPVGERFSTDAGKVWAPPLHPSCRCDIALEFHVTETVQDQIDEMIHSERVSKDMAGDPYDRDKSGRFASREQRSAPQFKVKDPFIADLERQLEEYVQSKPQLKGQVKLTRAKLSGAQLEDRINLGPKLGGPKLNAGPRLSNAKLSEPSLGKPQLGTPKFGQAKLGQPKMTQAKWSQRRAQLVNTPNLTDNVKMTDKTVITTRVGDDGEIQQWRQLDEPLMGFVRPHETIPGGLIYVTEDEPLYMENTKGIVDLNREIGDHWENAISDYIIDNLSDTEDLGFTTEGGTVHWFLSRDEAINILEAVVSGEDSSLEMEVQGYDLNGDLVHNTFFYGEIAQSLGMYDWALEETPGIFVMQHGSDLTEIYPGKYGYAKNPGTWRVVGSEAADSGGGLYDRIYVEPDTFQ